MSTISQVSEVLQWVLNEYPRMIERKTGFVQRSSAKLDGVTFVRGGRFVTWLPPSRDELKPENVFFRAPKVSFSLEKLPTSQLSLREETSSFGQSKLANDW
jgi:hypothetical protein